MAVIELGTLLDYQQVQILTYISATFNVACNLSSDGGLIPLTRDLTAQEVTQLQAQVAVIKAAPNPAIAIEAANGRIRGTWSGQTLGGMTTTQMQKIVIDANANFANAFRTADVTQIANYRSVINSTLLILANLPQAFVTEFTKERTALGLSADAVGATLADCQKWHQFLGGWIPRAGLWIAAAKLAGVQD